MSRLVWSLFILVFIMGCNDVPRWSPIFSIVIEVRTSYHVTGHYDRGDSGVGGAIVGGLVAGATGAVVGGLATRTEGMNTPESWCAVVLDVDGARWRVVAPHWALPECTTLRPGDRLRVFRVSSGEHVSAWDTLATYQKQSR